MTERCLNCHGEIDALPGQCTVCGYLNVLGDLPDGPRPLRSIVSSEGGQLHAAFIPVFPDDVQALDAKSREAVMAYLCSPDEMTKRQRDLIHYLRTRDANSITAKAKKLGTMAAIVGFLQKYKFGRH